MSVSFATDTKGFNNGARFATDGSASNVQFNSNTDFDSDLNNVDYANATPAAASEGRINANFNSLPFVKSRYTWCEDWHTEFQYQFVFRWRDLAKENETKHNSTTLGKRSRASFYPAFEQLSNLQQMNYILASASEEYTLEDILARLSIVGVGLKAKNLFEKTAQGHYLTKQPLTVEGHVEINDIFSRKSKDGQSDNNIREMDHIYLVLRKEKLDTLKFAPSLGTENQTTFLNDTKAIRKGKKMTYVWQISPEFSHNGTDPNEITARATGNDKGLNDAADHPTYAILDSFRRNIAGLLPANITDYMLRKFRKDARVALGQLETNIVRMRNFEVALTAMWDSNRGASQGIVEIPAAIAGDPPLYTMAEFELTRGRLEANIVAVDAIDFGADINRSMSINEILLCVTSIMDADIRVSSEAIELFTRLETGYNRVGVGPVKADWEFTIPQLQAILEAAFAAHIRVTAIHGVIDGYDVPVGGNVEIIANLTDNDQMKNTFEQQLKQQRTDGHIWRVGYIKEIKYASHYRALQGERMPTGLTNSIGTGNVARSLCDARLKQTLVIQLDLTGQNNIRDEYHLPMVLMQQA